MLNKNLRKRFGGHGTPESTAQKSKPPKQQKLLTLSFSVSKCF